MKLTALAVVILALGIVVGFALAGGASGGPASAVPQCPGPSAQCATPTPTPPPQQREDQIIVSAGDTGAYPPSDVDPDWSFGRLPVVVDSAKYPGGSVFQFEATWNFDKLGCARLAELTGFEPSTGDLIASPIIESTVCRVLSGFPVRHRSSTFTLPAGEHEYIVQWLKTQIGNESRPFASRIIAEWTE